MREAYAQLPPKARRLMRRDAHPIVKALRSLGACGPAIRWARRLPRDVTPIAAWRRTCVEWRDWLQDHWSDLPRVWQTIVPRPLPMAPPLEAPRNSPTGAFLDALHGRPLTPERAALLHPADAYTLRALGVPS